MYYVYVLKSKKDGNLYTGFTDNLKKRIQKHNNGSVLSTKARKPFELVYFEGGLNKTDALHREIYLKTAWGKRYIKNRIKNYMRDKKIGHSWIVNTSNVTPLGAESYLTGGR